MFLKYGDLKIRLKASKGYSVQLTVDTKVAGNSLSDVDLALFKVLVYYLPNKDK